MFIWASINVPAVHFGYCSNEDYEGYDIISEQYFCQSCTILDTRKLHSFVLISSNKVRSTVRVYSVSDTSKEERVTLGRNGLPPELIADFVTCFCDGNWWLACVLEIIQVDSLVRLTFLHPHGPSSSFIINIKTSKIICTAPIDNILTLV